MRPAGPGWCPECGTRYDAGTVACPSCRAVLVAPEDADEARAVISEHLAALERVGEGRDEDVEGESGK